jgi:signal peptidase I
VRDLRTRLVTGAIVLLFAVAWLVAGPARLGGTTTYVATHGISMEPRFHTGDLALVRPASEYRVGDVVAYRSAVLHSIVLHRVIALDGDRYVFKGDNNDFVDPIHPRRDELIGRLWVRVPHGGAVLGWLQSPLVAALLCGGVGLLLLRPVRRRRRRRHHRGDQRSRRRGAPSMTGGSTGLSADARMLLTGCAVAAAACLALGVLAWTRPATNRVAEKIAYTQKVRFSYRADAPAGAVYPSGSVRTGDPIFLRLVHQVRVKIAYRLVSGAPSRLSGTQEVRVRLTSPTGWNRTMELQPPTAFSGASSSAWVTLDLDRLQALIHRVETLIGAPSGAPFTVDVLPRVRVKGTLRGEALATRYEPALSFQLDALQLRSGNGAAGAAAASAARAPRGGAADGFAPSRAGSVAAATEVPNHLHLRGHALGVGMGRWLALAGLLLAAAVAALTTVRERRRPTDPSMQIHARYGHLIVSIASIVHDPAQPVVDVTSIDALAQIAERSERVILHHHRIGAESYLVDDDGTLFRYQPRHYLPQDAAAA